MDSTGLDYGPMVTVRITLKEEDVIQIMGSWCTPHSHKVQAVGGERRERHGENVQYMRPVSIPRHCFDPRPQVLRAAMWKERSAASRMGTSSSDSDRPIFRIQIQSVIHHLTWLPLRQVTAH